jgi:hypothetical protein
MFLALTAYVSDVFSCNSPLLAFRVQCFDSGMFACKADKEDRSRGMMPHAASVRLSL